MRKGDGRSIVVERNGVDGSGWIIRGIGNGKGERRARTDAGISGIAQSYSGVTSYEDVVEGRISASAVGYDMGKLIGADVVGVWNGRRYGALC
jgi:hypothetical protein